MFVSNSLSNSISEVVTSTDDVGGAYLMGANPVRGLVSADNTLLYVGNLRSQEVTVYAIDDGKRVGSIHVGDGPSAMAFSSAGHLLFVVDARSGDVAVVRTLDCAVSGPARLGWRAAEELAKRLGEGVGRVARRTEHRTGTAAPAQPARPRRGP